MGASDEGQSPLMAVPYPCSHMRSAHCMHIYCVGVWIYTTSDLVVCGVGSMAELGCMRADGLPRTIINGFISPSLPLSRQMSYHLPEVLASVTPSVHLWRQTWHWTI